MGAGEPVYAPDPIVGTRNFIPACPGFSSRCEDGRENRCLLVEGPEKASESNLKCTERRDLVRGGDAP